MESFRWFGGGINFVCIYIVYDNIINCYYYYCCCFKCVFESWPWNLDWVASLQSEATSSVVQLALPRPKNFINDINCHRQGLLIEIWANKSSKYPTLVGIHIVRPTRFWLLLFPSLFVDLFSTINFCSFISCI